MSDYIISCCSTADLSKEHFEKRDIHYVCFHYFLNGTEYPDDLGQSISFPDFYKAMTDGAETKTSQVNVSEYVDFFTPFLEQGRDILHVCLSSGLSGTINSARSAAEIRVRRTKTVASEPIAMTATAIASTTPRVHPSGASSSEITQAATSTHMRGGLAIGPSKKLPTPLAAPSVRT